MQASLQPRQSADDYELGMRIAGRDGKLWEARPYSKSTPNPNPNQSLSLSPTLA